jgi:NADH dehydrogenase
MKNVLIIGGTGTLGKELCHQLVAENSYKIAVLTREPKKNGLFTEGGIQLIKGDLTDAASLQTACKGMDIVIAAAHSLLGKGKYSSEKVDDKGHRDLIDAAKAAGVQHFIYASAIGASQDSPIDFWRTKATIENYLKQSGLNYTILRGAAFMEFHVHEMIGKPVLAKGKATILGKGENPTNFVSVKDMAQYAVLSLKNDELKNKTLEIGGLDNLSRNDIAVLYGELADKTVKISHVPRAVLRVFSTILKPFHGGISRVMAVSEYFDRSDMSFDMRPTLEKYPIYPLRLRDFIKEKVAEMR